MELLPPVVYIASLRCVEIPDVVSANSPNDLFIQLLCGFIALLGGVFDFTIELRRFHSTLLKKNGIDLPQRNAPDPANNRGISFLGLFAMGRVFAGLRRIEMGSIVGLNDGELLFVFGDS